MKKSTIGRKFVSMTMAFVVLISMFSVSISAFDNQVSHEPDNSEEMIYVGYADMGDNASGRMDIKY